MTTRPGSATKGGEWRPETDSTRSMAIVLIRLEQCRSWDLSRVVVEGGRHQVVWAFGPT